MKDALSHQLCYSFYHIDRLFNKFYKKNLQQFDLTYTQYLVLVVLWESERLTMHELGAALDLSSNTLTPLVKRLEEKGYLMRIRPEQDKRQLILQLTETGKALQEQIVQHMGVCFAQIDGLTKERAQEVIHENNQLIQALKDVL